MPVRGLVVGIALAKPNEICNFIGRLATSRSRGERAPRSSKAAWRDIDLFRLQEYTSD